MKLAYIYLILVNAAGFLLMLADKYKAKKNLWRIPEATLMGTALIGGSIGVLGGMKLGRHKTKHLKFSIGVPLIMAVQILIAIILIAKNLVTVVP